MFSRQYYRDSNGKADMEEGGDRSVGWLSSPA